MSKHRYKVVLHAECSHPCDEAEVLEAVHLNLPATVNNAHRHAQMAVRWNQRLNHAVEVCPCCDEDCGARAGAERAAVIADAEKAVLALKTAISHLNGGGEMGENDALCRASVLAENAYQKCVDSQYGKEEG